MPPLLPAAPCCLYQRDLPLAGPAFDLALPLRCRRTGALIFRVDDLPGFERPGKFCPGPRAMRLQPPLKIVRDPRIQRPVPAFDDIDTPHAVLA